VRCIFVLDILNGAVVHGVRGERSRYEPIERHSSLVSSSDPLQVLGQVMPREAYVADLNRLMGTGDNLAAIKDISERTKLMADIGIGISGPEDIHLLPKRVLPVIGTETGSMDLIAGASQERPVVVSLDMKNRRVLYGDSSLKLDPLYLLRKLKDFPLKSVIVLELDRVGTSSGIDAAFLETCASTSVHPLILGGGVKDVEDLRVLEDIGFQGALVATAVHNGNVPLSFLR
jgi:phosphoribosylformimino-5-aminoimidazole carboxamide ribotide isomerase